ncbi:MAG: hypothetical protein RBG13Loki_0523 [Promethearchaeota archaeon CR_4]|nr:MAG: hypothetical protein RBG13Loki_0523 [Candidatus Lokiarchaeota archaeon CR_4]
MNFILFITRLPSFSKRDIDLGNTPPLVYEIIEACRCAFFLSHAIRTDVNFALILLQDDLLILYRGEKLRYLGPDERSQALLLGKAMDIGRFLTVGQSKQSTPGLRVWKGGWKSILSELLGKSVILPRANAPVATTKEIITFDSCVLGIDCEVPLNLSESGKQIDLMERFLPPPYDLASLGTKILYLHHVRDMS